MLNVMLVDDERVVKKTIRSLIETETEGFRIVAEASDGREALQALECYTPDVVITDIRMPGMSGLTLMQEMSQRQTNTDFIIISGYGDFQYAQTAIRCGAADYILKPIDPDYFVAMLQQLKHKRMSRPSTNEPVHEPQAVGEHKHPMIQEVLSVMASRYADPNFSLGEVADDFGITPNYLGTLFKKVTGESFIRYLTRLRIEQAKQYLQKPFIKVYEIGHSVGFEDYSHFAKTFRKLNGCTPTEYRNEMVNHWNG
ncbi:response regulator [Paenibacillus sp. J2TS4]|uniref:response regulator transcription factor n=1 Tax=Paenibacillus sp. J2TS4 TaxID=2807194 RepID=UPI001AFFD752|nr:response regulator [Paenibacillus sp. J2TS4]GIP35802.1 DNA-binding response regulator [Paenibacillus sp. J2TS4]